MEGARADGLIETMHMAADGAIALWPHHMARVQHSIRALGFPPVGEEALAAAVAAALREIGIDAIDLGEPAPQPRGSLRIRLVYAREGRIAVTTAPLPELPSPVLLRWADEAIGPDAVLHADEPLLRHKSTTRPWYDAAGAWITTHPDVFDLMFCNAAGEVCEGSRSNLYARIDGRWVTPPVEAGCLPGTQRAALIAQGRVQIAPLTRRDVLAADALRVSNALRGWRDAFFVQHET